MSALFFKLSWQHTVDRFRDLQKQARKHGKRLVVKNTSRTRGIPCFLFFLTERGSDVSRSFHDLDGVAAALEGGE